MTHTSDINRFSKQIKNISQNINPKKETPITITKEQLIQQCHENNQLVLKIYELMQAQHIKLKQSYKQRIELQEQLKKVNQKYVQLNRRDKYRKQSQEINSPVSKEIESRIQNYIPINDGVYSIIHFKDQQTFQEAVPYLQSQAQFLTIQQFEAVRLNMEQAFRTSSRIELEASYETNLLHNKIDLQLSTIKKLSDEVQFLKQQNIKLKEQDNGNQLLKNQKRFLEQQLSKQQKQKKLLTEELSSLKQDKGVRSRSKTPTVIIRR